MKTTIMALAALGVSTVAPPAGGQDAMHPPIQQKAETKPKISCRIHMEGNMPRRICLTNEDWKKVQGDEVEPYNQSYINRYGCGGTLQVVSPKAGAPGAC